MNDSKQVPAIQIAVALGAVYLIWGSTYLAIRFAIETIPPFLMASARYLTAGILLYAWSRLRGAPRPRPAHWLPALALGALLLLMGNGGVVWAEQKISSGLAALLVSTEPLWIVLLVWRRDRREKPGGRVIAGLVLGFTGLVLLVRPSHSGGLNPLAVAAVMAASLCWAYGSLYSQRAKLPDSPLLSTAMQMLCGGGLLLLAGLATGETTRFALSQVSTRSLLALAYLVVFGAVIAFTAYVWLLRAAPPVLVSTYAYVNPVVAVLLGWALAGEPVTRGTLIAAAVILTGVALISSAQGKKGEAERPAEVGSGPAMEEAVEEKEEAEVCASR
jgi:drug/metabolite transporter (DMT)-like permease